MLSKIIVSSFEMLVEVSLWLFLLMSIIVGWNFGDGFLGAIGGLIAGFVFAVMIFGAFLVLGDIRSSVRKIENSMK